MVINNITSLADSLEMATSSILVSITVYAAPLKLVDAVATVLCVVHLDGDGNYSVLFIKYFRSYRYILLMYVVVWTKSSVVLFCH